MKNDLMDSIRLQLNIPHSSNDDWICQTVYSVAGQMALASLWDRDEDSESVSIKHLKLRMRQIFDAYKSLFPHVRYTLPEDMTVLLEEIYQVYLHNGFMYHSADHVSPCIPCVASWNNLTLHRGFSPDTNLFMSGLGFYSLKGMPSGESFANMFALQQQSFESYLEELLTNSEWESIVFPENTEFLLLDQPFSRGYWKREPDRDGRISLARYGEPNKIFLFYHFDGERYWQKQIPMWRLQDFYDNKPTKLDEYRRIAIALLMRYGTMPPIKVHMHGDLYEINLGYRLPPSEEFFYKLYSWPIRYDFSASEPQVFVRKMSKYVYPMFKHELETMGYCFVEESV